MKEVIDLIKERKHTIEAIKQSVNNVALFFIDMTESTAYKDVRGIELGVEKVILFNLDVTKIIQEKGEEYKQKGEIEEFEICKYIGDAVMAYFKGEKSSRVAIEIAIHIQKHFNDVNKGMRDEFDRYKPKIGIDSGEVLFIKYDRNLPHDPHGLIVDRAARIVSLAKPYQILISKEAKIHADSKISVIFSEKKERKFKGIKEAATIYEVIWDKELGIKLEEEPSILTISADEPTVRQFIKNNNLLEHSNQIDLLLYTYETLASALRYDLEELQTSIELRVIIRNPLKDPKKEPYIKSSIGTMAGVMRKNPKICYSVRFYDDEPVLRTYIFHKENNESEGLLSLYKWDPSPSSEHPFVGAEYNYLIHTRGRSFFEKHLLSLFQSRFNYYWDKFTEQKAVIFDLDGVVINSMPYYYQAWKKAFAKVDIDVDEAEIYRREGEKREITAKEVFKKFKGEEPSNELIKLIVTTKEEIYHKIFKVELFPGIEEILNILKAKNFKLGLATGSVTKTIEKLKAEEPLFSLFDVIITGEATKLGKPSPEPYLKAVEKLSIPMSNCYVVENAPLGIASAMHAGLTCFAIKSSRHFSEKDLRDAGAQFVYKNIEELKKYLIWADTNMNLNDFLEVFQKVL